MQESDERAITIIEPKVSRQPLPATIQAAGQAATFAFEEFFLGRLRNRHTRTAYLRAVTRFLAWAAKHDPELARITPGMVGQYFDELPLSVPSKKLHLAAIRAFFDVLVQRHAVGLNPALSVKTERYSALEGRTPEITVDQSRQLLASIKLKQPIDYRDRAIIAVLIYTAVREGAVAALRRQDLLNDGTQFLLRFHEKGGKLRQIPVRHDLQGFLHEYLAVGGFEQAPKESPFFRSVTGGQNRFSDRPVTGVDICRMVKRRLAAAGLPTSISPHSFRSCTATDLLLQGTPLEDVQYLLGHADPRTTRLYDRRQKQVTRNIVERISV